MHTSIIMVTFICREFNSYDANGELYVHNGEIYSNGDIELTFITDNRIEVLISDLLYGEVGMQAQMLINYAPNLDIYDTASTILYELSKDLSYLGDLCENTKTCNRDFICYYGEEPNTPEIWCYETSRGSNAIPFTRENAVHITTSSRETFYRNKKGEIPYYVIRGNVDENGVFTYDFPLIISVCSEKHYKKSRGNMSYFYDLYWGR